MWNVNAGERCLKDGYKRQEQLRSDADALGVSLTGPMLSRFEQYCDLLLDWNQRMNLTAIKEPDAVAVRHFADLSLIHI